MAVPKVSLVPSTATLVDWLNKPERFGEDPSPLITWASKLSAIAEAIPRRRSSSMLGKSARSSRRIRNWPVILLGARFVSVNAAAVWAAAPSAAFGPAGGAVLNAG